jgi:hypothetical protein
MGATDEEERAMAKTTGGARGGAKAKRAGKRPAKKAAARKVTARKAPARKSPARKSAARKAVAAKLAVKTKVPKARAKALVDEFQGKDVDVDTEYGTTGATLTMLRVSPTKVGDD